MFLFPRETDKRKKIEGTDAPLMDIVTYRLLVGRFR